MKKVKKHTKQERVTKLLKDPKIKKELTRIKQAKVKPKVEKVSKEPEAFTAWRNGTSIAELVTEFKMTRSQLRRLLTDAAGGKAKFRELRATGAGGSTQPFGGKSATPREPGAPAVPRDLDAKAKRIKTTRGWPVERIIVPATVRIKVDGEPKTVGWRETKLLIYTSPKTGKRYVEAKPTERADLLVRMPLGIPDGRLRRYEDSASAKRIKREVKEVKEQMKRGTVALKKERSVKKAKRLARKALVQEQVYNSQRVTP
jgi:hypothetical protein